MVALLGRLLLLCMVPCSTRGPRSVGAHLYELGAHALDLLHCVQSDEAISVSVAGGPLAVLPTTGLNKAVDNFGPTSLTKRTSAYRNAVDPILGQPQSWVSYSTLTHCTKQVGSKPRNMEMG